jgi:hypothetical protein
MMNGFRVDDSALSAHGDAVEALTARLRTAAAAGSPLGLGAYGVIGQVFAAKAVDAANTTARSVARLAEGAGMIGDGVRATTWAYREAERRAAAPFHTLGAGGKDSG